MLGTYRTSLIRKTQLTYNVYLFRFKLIAPSEFSFIAGQYMIVQISLPGGSSARRFISIASSNSFKNEFEGVMKIIPGGIASSYLTQLEEGNEVHFLGPAGKFNLMENERPKIFLATGTGIGPVRSMIQKLQTNEPDQRSVHGPAPNASSGTRVTNFLPRRQTGKFQINLFWGLPTWKDVYFLAEFKKLATSNQQFNFKICLSQEKALDKIATEDRKYFKLGRVNDELEKIGNWKLEIGNLCDYYLCGARVIVDSLRDYLLSKGITKESIHFERFV